MLVDDSAIVRGMIGRALTVSPGITIVASVSNGIDAIKEARVHKPDVILLDIEMPQMDGITALPKLLEASPDSKVIMASSFTMRNAEISMQALALGASDYIAKPSAQYPGLRDVFNLELRQKVEVWATPKHIRKTPKVVSLPKQSNVLPPLNLPLKAVAVAASTGGPQALLTVFGKLKGRLGSLPVFITQHMPATFTTAFAEHLGRASGYPCHEGKDGEVVRAGHIYLAPGDYHMLVTQKENNAVIQLNKNPPVNFCRPAADPMLESLGAVYGKHLLVAVMTGMGQDGLEGSRKIIAAGGSVIAQDEATSAVWGMNKAVATNNLCRAVLPLDDISTYLSVYL